jgi:hypothetical protein
MNKGEFITDLLKEKIRKELREIEILQQDEEFNDLLKGENMATLYQQVKWNNVFEVLQDNQGNLFIFKNNHYWRPATLLDEAKSIINSFKIDR